MDKFNISRLITKWLAGILMVMSFMVFSGWLTGNPRLVSLGSNLFPTAPFSALLFLLFALTIFFFSKNQPSEKKKRILKIVIGVIMLLTALIIVFSWQFVSQGMVRQQFLTGEYNFITFFWISPLSGFCFLLTGAALLNLLKGRDGVERRRWLMVTLVLLLLLLSISFLAAYIFGSPLYYNSNTIPPALPTSLAFFLMSLSIALWWTRLNLQDYLQGRLLPSRTSLIIIVFFIAITAKVLVLGYFSHRSYARHFRTETEEALMMLGEVKTREIQAWHEERLDDAEIIREHLEHLHDKGLDPCRPSGPTRQLLASTLGRGEYDLIRLYNAEGKEVFSIPQGKSADEAFCGRDTLDSLHKGLVQFCDLYYNHADDRVYLSVLVSLPGPGAEASGGGAILMRIDPQTHFFPSIQQLPLFGKTAETLLVRREGGQVVFLNPLRFGHNKPLELRMSAADNPLLPAAMATTGMQGVVEGIDYRGQPVVSSLHQVPGTPWSMVVRMDASEIYAPLLKHLVLTILLMTGFLALSWLFLFYLWRQREFSFLKKQIADADTLKTSELRWQFALEGSGNTVWDWNMITNHIYYSPSYKKRLGYDDSEFGDDYQAWINCVHPDDLAQSLRDLNDHIEGRTPFYQNDHRVRCKDGHYIWVMDRGKIVERDALGKPLRMIGTHSDITHRKEFSNNLEKQVARRTAELQATVKELDAFSYSVSHDLRAPLRVIEGFSSFLQEDYADKLDTEGLHMIHIIRENCGKMDQLITDLLQLSRTSRGKLKTSRVNMTDLAMDVWRGTATEEEQKNVKLQMASLHEIPADSSLITQVWKNLFSNALKYSRPVKNRTVTVESQENQNMVVYSVRDNGVGFDPAYTDKLFNTFQRLHDEKSFEGTGIGLAIVQRVITRHGGTVGATGQPGKGACFWFSLPLEDQNDSPSPKNAYQQTDYT